jgi:hypothetical protein
MNRRSQMQGGKNWILPKEIGAWLWTLNFGPGQFARWQRTLISAYIIFIA